MIVELKKGPVELCNTCGYEVCRCQDAIDLIYSINEVFWRVRMSAKTKHTIPAISLPGLPWRWTPLHPKVALAFFGVNERDTLSVADESRFVCQLEKEELAFVATFHRAKTKKIYFPTGFVHLVLDALSKGAIGADGWMEELDWHVELKY